MLLILHGANRFARNEYLAEYLASKNIEPEYIEEEDLSVNDLASLTQGQSLFSSERLVIIHDLSENADVWTALAEWVGKREIDADIILLESKLDKRKSTTKDLIKKATVKEFTPLKGGDMRAAASWLVEWAGKNGVKLDSSAASELVKRVGYDQGMLVNEVKRLAVLDSDVKLSTIREYTPDKLEARVFSILEAALKGDKKYLVNELAALRQLSDPYQFMGLLSSQVFQFMAIHFSGVSLTEVSSGLKLNSYALQNSNKVNVSRAKVRYANSALAEADYKMKSTSYDPWDLIEFALVDISLR